MNELKPCPFCGGEASIKTIPEYHGKHGDEPTRFFVDCDITKGHCECIPSTWHFLTKEEAVEAWNRRADDVPT